MRILVVEDEHRVASFVSRALQENGYEVDLADTGEKVVELVMQNCYDGILLDVRLPGRNGIQVCRELRAARIDTPVLMLTARSLVEQRVEGLDAGADDYLTKPFAIAELHARVRALTRRGFHKGGAKLQCVDLEFDRQRRRVTRASTEIQLTSKELSLLELLLLRSPEVVGRTEIVEQVWSYGFDTETNLVEVYINRLRHKIDSDHPIKLIHTVRGVGYRLGQ